MTGNAIGSAAGSGRIDQKRMDVIDLEESSSMLERRSHGRQPLRLSYSLARVLRRRAPCGCRARHVVRCSIASRQVPHSAVGPFSRCACVLARPWRRANQQRERANGGRHEQRRREDPHTRIRTLGQQRPPAWPRRGTLAAGGAGIGRSRREGRRRPNPPAATAGETPVQASPSAKGNGTAKSLVPKTAPRKRRGAQPQSQA